MTSSMVDCPSICHSDMSPQHKFKKKLSHQFQCWLHIHCGIAFAWEMTGGGNILHGSN